jgi:hypothetical protein
MTLYSEFKKIIFQFNFKALTATANCDYENS